MTELVEVIMVQQESHAPTGMVWTTHVERGGA